MEFAVEILLRDNNAGKLGSQMVAQNRPVVKPEVSRQVFHHAIKSPVRRSEPVTWQVPAVAGCGIATAFKRIVEQLKFPGKRPSSLTGVFSDLGFEEEHGW